MLVLISVKTGLYLGPWANVVVGLWAELALHDIPLVVPIVFFAVRSHMMAMVDCNQPTTDLWEYNIDLDAESGEICLHCIMAKAQSKYSE